MSALGLSGVGLLWEPSSKQTFEIQLGIVLFSITLVVVSLVLKLYLAYTQGNLVSTDNKSDQG